MSAQDVAWIGYHGLIKNKLIIVPGFKNKLSIFMTRLTPNWLQLKIIRNTQEKV